MLNRKSDLFKKLQRPSKADGTIPNPEPTSPSAILPFFSRWKWPILILALMIVAIIFHREPNISFHPPGTYCERFDVAPKEPAKPFPTECSSIESVGRASIAFVEFDDQGAYFDQRQSFAALRLIREALQNNGAAVEVFVFVHGWQHNANPDDDHVKQFKKFLAARAECPAQGGCPNKKTVGIYLGWPGQTLRPPLSLLTFWSRKAAAHRVASGSIQEFFATLQQVKSDFEGAVSPQKAQTAEMKTYVIGHSFGGLITYQANSQSLALGYGSAVLASREAPALRGLGNLVILINPAIEALRFDALNSLYSEYPNDPFYSPVMVVVSSRSDLATKFAFPAGVAAGTLFTNQLRRGQWAGALTTVGNSPDYLTHNAYLKEAGKVEICESRKQTASRKAPYWFISANPNLIDGHGDLNAEKLLAMFAVINENVSAEIVGGLRTCKEGEE